MLYFHNDSGIVYGFKNKTHSMYVATDIIITRFHMSIQETSPQFEQWQGNTTP